MSALCTKGRSKGDGAGTLSEVGENQKVVLESSAEVRMSEGPNGLYRVLSRDQHEDGAASGSGVMENLDMSVCVHVIRVRGPDGLS